MCLRLEGFTLMLNAGSGPQQRSNLRGTSTAGWCVALTLGRVRAGQSASGTWLGKEPRNSNHVQEMWQSTIRNHCYNLLGASKA